jgi:hypothetical protein
LVLFDVYEDMQISQKPRSVYRIGGRNKSSFAVTIPQEFAKIMKIDKLGSFVMIRLVTAEQESTTSSTSTHATTNGRGKNTNKKPYCIIEKLEQ